MKDDLEPTTILVADDDPEILALLSVRLAKSGYNILEADDGERALLLAQQHVPSLILLDVMMPRMNGWEVAKQIRQNDALKDVGIIMLTAIGENINEMTSPLYGADAHVDKPFDFKDVEEKVREVLTKRSSLS